ncbi:MAG: response regulator [Deltaproteobacteria bacterium]|nr:response regulator [Deltaproteobacteria bacterium]
MPPPDPDAPPGAPTDLSEAVARLQRELESKKLTEAQLRDQTQRLKEATERYEIVAKVTSDAVYDWDLESNRLSFGPGISKLFGHTIEAPTFEWWAEQLHPDERERVLLSLEAAMAPGKPMWSSEYQFRKGDGTYAQVFDRGIFQRDASGKPERMIGAMMDVTERRKLERRLMVADRLASVGQLAAGVAHEINNPLTYMMSSQQRALQLVEALAVKPISPGSEEAARELLADAARALREAEGGAERVRRIVRDLKTFARADEDSHALALDVRHVVDTALALAWNEIRHRATLSKSYVDVPRVRANESRLAQVFLGLLVNAAQAIPTGDATRNTIGIDIRPDERGRVVISISDTGAGMTQEVQGHLFEPFFTTKAAGGGTGLSLAISRSIITGLEGDITVESAEGKGSTFRVSLPPAPEDTWAERPPPAPVKVLVPEPEPSSEPEVPRGRVLIVDDEPLILSAASRTLSAQHEVEAVGSGQAALEKLRAGLRYDAIICDLMMPEVTGMDLYETLLEWHPEQAQRVVFLSGGAFTPAAQEFLNRALRPILEKPFRGWELRAAVASVIAAQGLVKRG